MAETASAGCSVGVVRRLKVRICLLVLVLLLVSGTAGCLALRDALNGRSGVQDAQGPVATLINPGQRNTINLRPAWTAEYDRPVVAALSTSGGFTLIGRSYGSVRSSTNWSAILYGADGGQLWERSYAREKYRTIEVAILGSVPYFAVAAYTYSNSGVLYVYGADGVLLWSRPVASSVTVRASAGGDKIVGIDRGKKALFVVDAQTGRELATGQVNLAVALQLAQNGGIVLSEPTGWVLLDPLGQHVAEVTSESRFSAIELGPQGDAVFAAIGGAASQVLRYDRRGAVLWQTELPVGGTNNLAVSPDGAHVIAYNVGLRKGLLLLDAADGRILVDVGVGAVEGATGQFIKQVWFAPDDRGLLVDFVVVRDPGSAQSEEHILLLLDHKGTILHERGFGLNVDLQVDAGCNTIVAVSTMPVGQDVPTVGSIQVFQLTPLFAR